MVVFHIIFNMWHGLHYHTFIGRNLENKKKLTPVRIMKTMDIVNYIGIFNDSVVMNSIFSELYRD